MLGMKMLLTGAVDNTLTVLYDPNAYHPVGWEGFIVGHGESITRTDPITLNVRIGDTFTLDYRHPTRVADKIDGRFSLSDHSFGVKLEKNILTVTALPAMAYVMLR